ncbi:TetR/AcrR family transcriptional regulator [Nocardia sp. CA-128927]|uniref:TetR/AcrR family transcriptional regulator n=1 Tax=Nocardia sp. CA-128927 TaxID=3239975 RepID=UPI003D9987AB
MPEAGRVRRTPRQTRSLERVDRILAAAAALVQEGGVEAATTTAIAARADVSPAALYQFFANRDAVLERLIADHVEELDRKLAAELTTLRPDSIAAAIDAFMTIHHTHYLAHPQFVALYYGGRQSRGITADVHAHLNRLVDMCYSGLIGSGLLPHETDRRAIEVAVELGDRVFELAYRHGPDGSDWIIAEGTSALTRYLEAHQ